MKVLLLLLSISAFVMLPSMAHASCTTFTLTTDKGVQQMCMRCCDMNHSCMVTCT